jgi:hypothetical protein
MEECDAQADAAASATESESDKAIRLIKRLRYDFAEDTQVRADDDGPPARSSYAPDENSAAPGGAPSGSPPAARRVARQLERLARPLVAPCKLKNETPG